MKKMLSLMLVLVLVSTMFMACGTKKETEPETTQEETTGETGNEEVAEEEEPLEVVEIDVAYMPNLASLASVVAGMRMGYFEEQGLKINLVEFADGPTIIAAMESGSIEIGYIGPGAHKLAVEGNADIIAISQFGNSDEVIGNKSKGVSTMADLKGKTIAVASGTSSETILNLTLADAGLTKDDVTLMDMDASAIVTAMISGSVDAAATWSPNTFAIKNELGDDAVMLSNNTTYVSVFPSIASWIVNPKYGAENPDIVQRFTKGIMKAMDYRADHMEEIAGWVAEDVALDKDSVLEQIYDGDWVTSDYIKAGIQDGSLEAIYKAQQDNFLESGAISKTAEVRDYVMFQNMLDAIE